MTATESQQQAGIKAIVNSAEARYGEPAQTVVRIRGASKSFGERHVLDGINLDIQRGEFVSVLGHSGTGKSTLLRLLDGFDPDFEGTIEVPARSTVSA